MTLKEHRRALHRIPEIGWETDQTAAYIKNVLQELPCQVFSPLEGAVCAFFDYGRENSIAFRADMDALPICEETGLPYASEHPGKMHACGHDGHMAILLGLAEHLGKAKDLNENVLLIFQPAEETTGGAKPLCDTGLLEEYKVECIYGLHLWPELPKGTVAAKAGGQMARSCEFTVEIAGKTAHIAHWQQSKDALFAAAQLLTRLYALTEDKPCILRFGRMESGSVRNAVSDRSLLEGSLRCFDDGLFEALQESIAEIAHEVSRESGCEIRLSYSAGYPPLDNDERLLRSAGEGFPSAEAEPSFTTEDFSWYQRRVPGLFFWLGTGGAPLHSSHFDFDESLLQKGLDLLKSLL